MFFTSGTTAAPKGVVLPHASLLGRRDQRGAEMERLGEDDVILAYLPPAWIGQNIFPARRLSSPATASPCPEAPETVMTDMREIGPTYYFAPPRVLRGLLTQVSIRMDDAAAPEALALRATSWALPAAWGALLDGKPVGLHGRALYGWATCWSTARCATCSAMTRPRGLHRGRGDRPGSVQVLPLDRHQPEAAVRLDRDRGVRVHQPDGEVRSTPSAPRWPASSCASARSASSSSAPKGCSASTTRTRRPRARRRTPRAGSIPGTPGFFDAGGHVKIIDRVKDVGKLADGTLFAPKYLENKLKFFPVHQGSRLLRP